MTTNGIGGGALHLASPAGGTSAVTLLMVAQSARPGDAWQRLASTFNGAGKDWEAPNWSLSIPSADKPTGFPPQVFMYRGGMPRTLQSLTLGGTAMGNYHIFTGQFSEILLYTRALTDDEVEAVETYLTEKRELPPRH